jgi:citrate synthase
MATDTPTRGLEHVIAAESSLADVDGTAGTLRYCGYDIHDLVDRVSFEEVLALLWDGDLPAGAALTSLQEALAAERSLSLES